jgi:hypothetical protein
MSESTLGLIYSEYVLVLVILSMILTQSPFKIFFSCMYKKLIPQMNLKWVFCCTHKQSCYCVTVDTLLHSNKPALPSLYILYDNSFQVSENWIYKLTWNFPLMHFRTWKVQYLPSRSCSVSLRLQTYDIFNHLDIRG